MKPLRLLEQCRLGRDRCPEVTDLLTRPTNIPEPDSMIWRRSDPLTKTDIGNEAQLPLGDPKCAFLGVQKNVLHGHQVAGHFTADFPSFQTSLFPLTSRRIRSFRHTQHGRPNSVLAATATDQKIWTN